MKAVAALVAFCALACLNPVHARPVVIENVTALHRPDASWQFFGRFGVAIDGDWALVSGERDMAGSNGLRHEGAAFLYLRSGSNWNYVGMLGPVSEYTDHIRPGLAMKDGVAVTMIGNARVFERSGTTWTWTSYIDIDLQGPDVDVSQGRTLIPRISCNYEDVVARDFGGLWTAEAFLGVHGNSCGPNPPSANGDLQGNLAAIIAPTAGGFGPAINVWRRTDSGWPLLLGGGISEVGNLTTLDVALADPFVAMTGRRERGTTIIHLPSDSLPFGANSYKGLQAVDAYLEPGDASETALERVGAMFAQRNYSFDRKAYVINLFRIHDNQPFFTSSQVATLQTRDGTSLGYPFDTSGNRIIVSGRPGFTALTGSNTVRIFELPASFDTPPVQLHDFESPSDGAFWQPIAGSMFSIVTAGRSHVYRQTSTVGDAASFLPSSTAANQAIQAEVTIRAVSGADRWVGLATRRADDSNYYYVTLRTSGQLELKRKLAGEATTLANAPVTVSLGRKYLLRLESIGTLQRVYLDGLLLLSERDTALGSGDAGVIMYRASADFDNVIVTPSPFTTIYTDNFSSFVPSNWSDPIAGRQWQASGGVFHLTYNPAFSAGHSIALTGAPTDDQVVRARIRPTSFVQPDNWVGLFARYQDPRNYLYVSLRGRGIVSLWRRAGNVITQLATRALTVTPGTWYDVRLEVVGGRTRVYVNNELQLWSNADPGPVPYPGDDVVGRVGLVTYRASADYDDFVAYQP